MMKATVPILSDKDCRTVYGQATITDSMICAGFTQGGTDACQVQLIKIICIRVQYFQHHNSTCTCMI